MTLNCFESGNCGNWANPSLWCNELAIGDPVEKVYFKLGNPSFIRGNNYTWQASKASTDVITAQIVNNTLSPTLTALTISSSYSIRSIFTIRTTKFWRVPAYNARSEISAVPA